MMRKRTGWLGTIALVGVTLIALQLLLSATPAALADDAPTNIAFANGAFRKVWETPDYPEATGKVQRSFVWGPDGWAFQQEDYAESPGGKRLVEYFDKTRMEITNPNGNTADPYFVTNGLLAKEMVSGRVQLGNNKFQDTAPAEVPVAGDAVNNPGPTYRSFKGVASLNLDNKSQRSTGAVIKATINRDGKVDSNNDLAKYNVKNQGFDETLSHNVPDVFVNYMTQQGQIYQNGQFVNGYVINSIVAMGLPLTEAYWSRVVVGGKEKDVLIQVFERRVLTYTPDNPDAYKVEMGNVGAHYYAWRYPGKARNAPWATFQAENQTECSLELSFSGTDTFVVDIAAYKTSTFRVGPGQYHYKATTPGCNSIPFESDATLDPNGKKEIAFHF